jgi:ABC-type uncharacterized transport system permease subunit
LYSSEVITVVLLNYRIPSFFNQLIHAGRYVMGQ